MHMKFHHQDKKFWWIIDLLPPPSILLPPLPMLLPLECSPGDVCLWSAVFHTQKCQLQTTKFLRPIFSPPSAPFLGSSPVPPYWCSSNSEHPLSMFPPMPVNNQLFFSQKKCQLKAMTFSRSIFTPNSTSAPPQFFSRPLNVPSDACSLNFSLLILSTPSQCSFPADVLPWSAVILT